MIFFYAVSILSVPIYYQIIKIHVITRNLFQHLLYVINFYIIYRNFCTVCLFFLWENAFMGTRQSEIIFFSCIYELWFRFAKPCLLDFIIEAKKLKMYWSSFFCLLVRFYLISDNTTLLFILPKQATFELNNVSCRSFINRNFWSFRSADHFS